MVLEWKLSLVLLAAALLPSCGGGGGGGGGGRAANPPTGTPAGDTTPPTVLTTNPSSLTSGVATNATLSVTFSEPVNVPAGAFVVTQGTASCSGTVSVSGNTATFTPTGNLGTSLTYTASLTTAIKDLAGNALTAPVTWSFTSADCNAISLSKQFALGAAVAGSGFKTLATDGASIYLYNQDYLAAFGTLFRIDPLTGAIANTTVIPLVPLTSTVPNGINFIADITWHDQALWASGTYIGTQVVQGVFKVNLSTGLAESAVPIAAAANANEVIILQGLASDGANKLYLALDRNVPPPGTTVHSIVTFNPATVAEVPWSPALLGTSGQITRLTYGDGFLWLFVNPHFQKVDPNTGTVLMTYCKTDGGANLLYFNHLFWTIKDTSLMAYSLN